MQQDSKPKIGLALGSGSARGLAHIGVIRALERYQLSPDIICGCSIGAFMAAAHAIDCLDDIEEWLDGMSTYDLLKHMDIRLLAGSGIADGDHLMNYVRERFGNPNIEDLKIPYAAVATDMKSGREIWLQNGPVWDAARASMALPGILTPTLMKNRWLLDGGLVNPVPVSLCKALGADIIIAVNLNGDLVSRQKVLHTPKENEQTVIVEEEILNEESQNFFDRLSVNIRDKATPYLEQWMSPSQDTPGLFNVIASSINIMQDRITRSRLAGEPADIVLTPRLNHIGMMEFGRAKEIIAEGDLCVQRMESVIEHRLGGERQS